jgi:thiol-disulfide isomerase/thioredoxin
VSLGAFRGKPVLVNFWASWCPGCRAEMPELEKLSRDRPGCLAVVGIAEDSGDPQEVLAFARERGVTYPLLLDDGSAAIGYGVTGIPYSVLIDAQGNVVRLWMGEITREVVKSAVKRLGPPPLHC